MLPQGVAYVAVRKSQVSNFYSFEKCAPGPSGPTEHSVDINNFEFSPKALMGVKVGDTITWTNAEKYV